MRTMRNIPYGASWSEDIEKFLDSAGVLIAIATDVSRREFAYTGLEIGYFLSSIKTRPKGETGVDRVLIPLYLTTNLPAALSDKQGANFKELIVSLNKLDLRKSSEEVAKVIKINDDDPAYKLLKTLEGIAAPTCPVSDARKDVLTERARKLYTAVIGVVRSQPVSDEQPKSKFIVHLAPDKWDLQEAQIEVQGPLINMLALKDGGYLSWIDVENSLKKSGAVDEWREAIQSVLRAARNDKLDEGDEIVSSIGAPGSSLVRMFVSRSVLYRDGRRDIHIYVVKLKDSKDYGDPFTTTLWKGIGSCIKVRFMLLEKHQDFSPLVIRAYGQDHNASIREYARELKTELYSAERLWRTAGLSDLKNVIRIMGSEDGEKVTDMAKIWWQKRDALVMATDKVISSSDTDLQSATEQWINALEDFRLNVSAYNAQFLIRMLEKLKKIVKEAAEDDPTPA